MFLNKVTDLASLIDRYIITVGFFKGDGRDISRQEKSRSRVRSKKNAIKGTDNLHLF
jgi:hypothetical protein